MCERTRPLPATPGAGKESPLPMRIPAHDGFTPAIRASRVSGRPDRRSAGADLRARQPRPPPPSDQGVSGVRTCSEARWRRGRPRLTRRAGSGPGHAATARARDGPREGDRLRQPEGRRRQDDDHAEPRGGLRRGGPPGAGRRHGPAGQPHDEPGHRPRLGREVDVRRARRRPLDPRGDPQARGRRGLRLDRPGGRRDRDEHQDRARALAREGAQGRAARTTTSCASTRRRPWAC